MIPNFLTDASCAAFWINHVTSHTQEHLRQMYPLATKIPNGKRAATVVPPPQKELLPQPTHDGTSTTSTSSPRPTDRALRGTPVSSAYQGWASRETLVIHFHWWFSWDLVNFLCTILRRMTHLRLLSAHSWLCGSFVERALPHRLHES